MNRKRIILMTAGVAGSVLLLSACSNSGSSTSAFTPKLVDNVSAATAPVDSVTWNLPDGEPYSLDPAQSAVESNSTVVANLCESLMTQTPSGELQPGLATSIDKINDTTYVAHLRPGVTFWDGKAMTADDVVYSINRILDPALGSSWTAWASSGATVTATAPDEVTIATNEPNAMMPQFFATPAFSVVEKAFAESAGADFGTASGGVMCTGPYSLGTWSSGSDITVKKNDSWWNKDVTPLVGSATFTFTSDPSAQVAALRSGSVDGSFMVPVSSFDSLSGIGNLLFNKSYKLESMSVANLKGSLADVKTRAALKAVIDYDGIASSIYRGTAEPIRAIVPPSAWGYSKDIYQKAYDALPAPTQNLDEAKKLLSESSYDGSEIVLAYAASSEEDTKIAAVVADNAKGIGLKVTLKPMQPAEYSGIFSDDPAARAGIDVFLTTGYLDFPEPAAYYEYSTTGSYYNFAGYSNPEFDETLAQAIKTSDDDARAELVTKAQALLTADATKIPLVSQYVNTYYSSKLAGLTPAPSYLYSPWLASLGGK
ncbi:ABC transporter substrate-binding protein [Agreia pratensis]|uniref:Peptide/nickel transport system substrate-binding protein n=1 Tax=Agreia pratensis TaxID=150121 RepID=A0A1X7IW89_9MICO|nr:ABC transporter substrate-binding protein [Agreia pratensis]SMG19192.1 peptide/nickel transport system substrate-binding protein [Agreia pratensis]